MTTNEIKTLIQNTIAGQGNQVDIGGKLAGILSAIVDAIPSVESVRPITLTSAPTGVDTYETLAAKGLSTDEVLAASRGERTGVAMPNGFYQITYCEYTDPSDFSISFCRFIYSSSKPLYLKQYHIIAQGGLEVHIEG